MTLPLDTHIAVPSPRVAARRRDNGFYTTMGGVAFVLPMIMLLSASAVYDKLTYGKIARCRSGAHSRCSCTRTFAPV
ncbi:MAG: hypothetical protein ACJ79A_16380 [Gemmatimonadaceae bacterium]